MPLEAGPAIIDRPAQMVPPKHPSGALPRHPPLKKKDKASSSAQPKDPSKVRPIEKEAPLKPAAEQKRAAKKAAQKRETFSLTETGPDSGSYRSGDLR